MNGYYQRVYYIKRVLTKDYDVPIDHRVRSSPGPANDSFEEGAGYVDIFDAAGNLVLRFEHGPWMNAPWGMAYAPTRFGKLGDHVLVGNEGNGRISIFDPATGVYEGYILDVSGSALTIPGLRALGFGNDGLAGPETGLYFTAGDTEKGENVFGTIIPSSALPHSALTAELIPSP